MIDKDGRDRSTASTYAFIGISQYTIDLNKQIAFSEGVHIGNGLPRLEKLIGDGRMGPRRQHFHVYENKVSFS